MKANKVYGNNKFDYPIFNEKPNLKWKSFVLRNSGNDFGRMLFRDGYLQLAREEPDRFAVIDAAKPVPDVTAEIRRIVEARFFSA